jgi:hypothetical protein
MPATEGRRPYHPAEKRESRAVDADTKTDYS